MKRTLSALLVLLLLSGCYKTDESHLNEVCTSGCAVFNIHVGTGNNSATPVSGAFVDLIWEGPKQEALGGPSIDIATGYTDVRGMVSFKFKPIGNEFTQGYFDISVKSTADYLPFHRTTLQVHNPDTVLNTTVHLSSMAYLKFVYKNFAPKDSADFFDVQPYYDTYGTNSPALQFTSSDAKNYPNMVFFSNDKPFDSVTFVGLTGGNEYTYFQVLINRNGIRIDHRDSIYVAKGTLGTYRVDYQHSFQ
ncbi:MAG: hypothetical protein ACXVI9_03870 [Mucilaginibacter sp.]